MDINQLISDLEKIKEEYGNLSVKVETDNWLHYVSSVEVRYFKEWEVRIVVG